jgi:hypothetical protein
VLLSACARVETGEVGLRQNFDKTIDPIERLPGSFNQVMVGDILLFKVQEVGVNIDNLHPQAKDNSVFKDFDMTVIYNITPSSVSDLWTTKNRGFHTTDGHDILLMNNYVAQSATNAAFKAVRNYEALTANDHKAEIEQEIKHIMTETFAEEKLSTAITLKQVQVRTIQAADTITESANNLVKAKNDLETKKVEVNTATEEAKRISALNANAKAIDYMNAQANLKIAEGVATGKVTAIIVPYDFKGILNVPTPAKK